MPYGEVAVIERVCWPFPVRFVRLFTSDGVRSVPQMSEQDAFLDELSQRCVGASFSRVRCPARRGTSARPWPRFAQSP